MTEGVCRPHERQVRSPQRSEQRNLTAVTFPDIVGWSVRSQARQISGRSISRSQRRAKIRLAEVSLKDGRSAQLFHAPNAPLPGAGDQHHANRSPERSQLGAETSSGKPLPTTPHRALRAPRWPPDLLACLRPASSESKPRGRGNGIDFRRSPARSSCRRAAHHPRSPLASPGHRDTE